MKKNSLFTLFLLPFFMGATNDVSGKDNVKNLISNDLRIENDCKVVNGAFPLEKGSVWSYNDQGVDLTSTNWKAVDFDDSTWATGNAKFGYGDGNEVTRLDFGADSNNKRPTYYFRYTFDIADVSGIQELIFNTLNDDGVVVYINGVEAFRENMPTGSITYNTYAVNAIGGSNENDFEEKITANLLQVGANVIAVELHQADAGSSDVGFDMEVFSEVPPLEPAIFPLVQESEWNYLDSGSDLDNEAWTQASYSYVDWKQGFGALGYGDTVNTVVSFGPDANNKFITTYFSRDLEVNLADLTDAVKFGLKRDDGAVVYVNGVEVFRSNMPDGTITYLTTSSTIVSGNDENIYYSNEVPKTAFVNGVNRIAVELHNRDGQSSDLQFDMFIQNTQDPAETFVCEEGAIGCFTSIVPTGQTGNMIIPNEHRFQLILKQGDVYTVGGGIVPGNNDFTGYVPINGDSELGYLSVNHENSPGGVSIVDLHFDVPSQLWVSDKTQPVDLYNNALVTTTRNCSGGITPWGTVVTAEESTNAGDANGDGYQDVGWLVEIDPVTAQVKDYGNGQEKLWAMGRMGHENVVVSPDSKVAYYGEDGGTQCVYKYVMDTPGDLSAGKVFVLKLDAPLVNNDPTSTTGQWILVPNTTKEERNNIRVAAAALGGTNFNGVEDCEINPITGDIYFTSKGKDRVYRFKDGESTLSEFETFVGGRAYAIETAQGTFSEDWGSGNDNLTFDDKGNLWVLQDGGKNYIWVVRPNHTQDTPNVALFASMPIGAEPTGLTFTPDFKYGFFSVQHPSGNNNNPQEDATFGNVVFNGSATVVIALSENLGAQKPVADFSADNVEVDQGETVTFQDSSTNNPTSWSWIFEGGIPATSTEATPTVVYNEVGMFDVSLVTGNVAGTSDVAVKAEYITVAFLNVDEALKNSVKVYPNPTSGNVTIDVGDHAGENVSVEVFDLLGRSLFTKNKMADVTNIELDLTQFVQANQVLIIKVNVGNLSGTYKVLKKN